MKFGHNVDKVKGEKKSNMLSIRNYWSSPDKHIYLMLKLSVSSLIIYGGVAERSCVRLQKTVYEQLANI